MLRRTAPSHVLVFLDLDRFKLINDTVGHAAGDELLAQGGSVLRQQTKKGWYPARLGGDEFGLLIENATISTGRRIAELIRRNIREHRFSFGGRSFQTTVSISVVPINNDTQSPTELLAAADVACQLAKDTGRDTIKQYDINDHNLASFHDRIKQASTINEALENDRFIIYGQRIAPLNIDIESRHFEVLLRMKDNDDRMISPGVFIPAAEKYGLISTLDRWVLTNALEIMQRLDSDHRAPEITCSINVSGGSISDPGFFSFIERALSDSTVAADRITLEVTETVAISNISEALSFIRSVKALGCMFALDDFGVGTSSFGYLRTLPVDYVKIDGSFVRSIIDSKLDFTVVRSINEIVHLMGLKTVAEFVENAAIFELLKETGIDYGQGYEIDRPSPLIDKYRIKDPDFRDV